VKTGEKYLNWILVFAWMGLIFGLSSIPNLRLCENMLDFILRKMAHAAEFFILAFLWYRALKSTKEKLSEEKILFWSCFFSIIYAFTDELHQFLVPTRHFSLFDVLIDTGGVLLFGILFWKKQVKRILTFALVALLSGCAVIRAPSAILKEEYSEKGLASWYGPGYYGRRTASGEVYTGKELTGAHRTLPFNTLVKVTRLDNKKSVIVRINDCGPWKKGYIIDLSAAAARKIGLVKSTMVGIRVVK